MSKKKSPAAAKAKKQTPSGNAVVAPKRNRAKKVTKRETEALRPSGNESVEAQGGPQVARVGRNATGGHEGQFPPGTTPV